MEMEGRGRGVTPGIVTVKALAICVPSVHQKDHWIGFEAGHAESVAPEKLGEWRHAEMENSCARYKRLKLRLPVAWEVAGGLSEADSDNRGALLFLGLGGGTSAICAAEVACNESQSTLRHS
jgi:hypothetical protein